MMMIVDADAWCVILDAHNARGICQGVTLWHGNVPSSVSKPTPKLGAIYDVLGKG